MGGRNFPTLLSRKKIAIFSNLLGKGGGGGVSEKVGKFQLFFEPFPNMN